jgi:hypothetical protein
MTESCVMLFCIYVTMTGVSKTMEIPRGSYASVSFTGEIITNRFRYLYLSQLTDLNMTTTDQLTQLKFPIGPFVVQENISKPDLDAFIATVESAPARYRAMTENLSGTALKKTYREGSWNVQQLVNHVADMQLLHFFRMKRALTEADYKEITMVNIDGWAHTSDGLTSPVADSLHMFEGITKRFIHLMKSLDEKQHDIAYYHPVRKTMLNQKQAISMSAWHVSHHLEHIRIALAG